MRNYLYLIIGVFSLGFNGIFVKLSETAPVATAAWRIILALPFLIIIDKALSYKKKTPKQLAISFKSRDFFLIIIAGIFFGVDMLLWNISFSYTSVAEATLMVNLTTFIVFPISILFFNEKVFYVKFIVGLTIAIMGIVGLTISNSVSGVVFAHAFGNMLAFLAAFFYSIFLVIVKVLRGKYSAPKIIFYSAVPSIITLVMVSIFVGGSFFPVDIYGWLILVGVALICHIFGQTLISYAVGYLPIIATVIVLMLQPVAAAIYAYVILGQKMTWASLVYMSLIMVGVVLAKLAVRPGDKPKVSLKRKPER